jgi:hypothetical protein
MSAKKVNHSPEYIAFRTQQYNAGKRKIEWLFTFEKWKQKWDESGKWHLRGSTNDKPYQMCRYNDVGPYSYDNTYIGTTQQNAKDRIKPKIDMPKNPRGRPQKQIVYDGVTYANINELADHYGISERTARTRLQANGSLDKSLHRVRWWSDRLNHLDQVAKQLRTRQNENKVLLPDEIDFLNQYDAAIEKYSNKK